MPVQLSIGSFDPFAWVNEYTLPSPPISEETFISILQFYVIWNLFERDACNNYATATTIKKAVNLAFLTGKLSSPPFQEHLLYFQDLYAQGDFSILPSEAIQLADNRDVITKVLLGTVTDINNKVVALLLIALKVRSNFYNEMREDSIIYKRADLFQVVNSLLATFLRAVKSEIH